MIAFSLLGNHGRLGNQLFQYAFVRFTARRLGVPFFVPRWVGDRVLTLEDENERVPLPGPFSKTYAQPTSECGFSEDAARIEDDTDIAGYFQSERYFDDPAEVRRWFAFRKDATHDIDRKYASVPFERCAAFHLRLGDYRHPYGKLMHYPATRSYFERALRRLPSPEAILVFSDEPRRAKAFFAGFRSHPLVFVEGNHDYEDLYLLSRCRDFVGSASTFSWWGAWLSANRGRVILPEPWFRKGFPCAATAIYPPEWLREKAYRPPTYDYRTGYFFYRPAAWAWNRLVAPRSRS